MGGRRPWFSEKKAAKSKSKPRLKPRTTSKRSRAALADPECLGADVNALVTQRLVGIAKRLKIICQPCKACTFFSTLKVHLTNLSKITFWPRVHGAEGGDETWGSLNQTSG